MRQALSAFLYQICFSYFSKHHTHHHNLPPIASRQPLLLALQKDNFDIDAHLSSITLTFDMSFGGSRFLSGSQAYYDYYDAYGYDQGYANMPQGAIRPFYPDDEFDIHSQWIGMGNGSSIPLAEWEDQEDERLGVTSGLSSGWYSHQVHRIPRASEVATRDDFYVPFQSVLERDGRHAYRPGHQAYPQFGVPYARARRREAYGNFRPSEDLYAHGATFNLPMRDAPDYGSVYDDYW